MKRATDDVVLKQMSHEALMAWFKCDSCFTCTFREEVLSKHKDITDEDCFKMHFFPNTVKMIELFEVNREATAKNREEPRSKER